MANAKQQKSGTKSSEIHVDSKKILQCKDEQEDFTEKDACGKRISQLFDPSMEYKMKHKRRGLALIFNHESFSSLLNLSEREGTHADRDNLYHSLTELGFEVRCFDDLRKQEVLDSMDNASKEQHEDADCFMCVFLTHGEDNQVYAYDDPIEIKELTNKFRGDKCPSLIGKPKIFIIQACRGSKFDDPVFPNTFLADSVSDRSLVNETKVDAAVIYSLPAGADFLMCYSVAEGFYSFRRTLYGSWYIQDLCEMIQEYGASLEFTELLMLVNRKVSQRRVDKSRIRGAVGKKQIPCFASMLTKKLYFHPKS